MLVNEEIKKVGKRKKKKPKNQQFLYNITIVYDQGVGRVGNEYYTGYIL